MRAWAHAKIKFDYLFTSIHPFSNLNKTSFSIFTINYNYPIQYKIYTMENNNNNFNI